MNIIFTVILHKCSSILHVKNGLRVFRISPFWQLATNDSFRSERICKMPNQCQGFQKMPSFRLYKRLFKNIIFKLLLFPWKIANFINHLLVCTPLSIIRHDHNQKHVWIMFSVLKFVKSNFFFAKLFLGSFRLWKWILNVRLTLREQSNEKRILNVCEILTFKSNERGS